MFKKKTTSNKNKVSMVKGKSPYAKYFKGKKPGRQSFKPLVHKDGNEFTDIEYFELLGRKAIEMEEERKQRGSNVPINYTELGYDTNCVKVAKTIVQAIDEKRPISEIEDYLKSCVDYSELD